MSFPEIPEGHALFFLLPLDDNTDRARVLAHDLLEVAMGGRSTWAAREAPPVSQSDRLVMLTGMLGQIAGLLAPRYEVRPIEPAPEQDKPT